MKITKRAVTLLLLLLMLAQCLPGGVEVFAANKQYDYSDISNSGKRHETAISLDGTGADAYYEGANEFDALSSQDKDTILQSLRNLMTSTHKINSTYDDCRDMAVNTDCENEDGRINLIYTSFSSQRSWYINDISQGWNREHVWPKSLGGYNTTGAGADLHHIRPSDSSVNGTRGNKKYGNNPDGSEKYGVGPSAGVLGGYTGKTYFEPLDNAKGDVARICLYMYVRYGGETQYRCGDITVVFESIDVLLDWCALDPVDTWELGRNEVVEAYQGNRNVFIDYPEYAWLIFGREVPADMTTPSGEASGGVVAPPTGSTEPSVPTEPESAHADFTDAMGQIIRGKVSGEEKFNLLCKAVNAYHQLTEEEKQTVSGLYDRLQSELTAYNQDINKVNADSNSANDAIFGIAIAMPLLAVAAYSLLGKKFF